MHPIGEEEEDDSDEVGSVQPGGNSKVTPGNMKPLHV